MSEAEVTTENEEPQRTSIIIISDFVCPWCYIGHIEVERLKQEYDFDIGFAPFYLHPETPPEGMPRRVTPPDAPLTPMEARGEDMGIHFRRGRTWTSNSYLSLQAAEFANDYGDRFVFDERMFKAYFDELEDIGNIDTVVRIGGEAGLPTDSLRAALEEGRYRQKVDEGVAWSRAIGVNAVPTFVFNEQYGMVGAQELDGFRQMMAHVGAKPRSATV